VAPVAGGTKFRGVKLVEIVRTLLRLSVPYNWAVPLLVLLGVLSSITEGIGIGLFIPLVEALEGGQTIGGGPLVGFLRGFGAEYSGFTRLILIGGTIMALVLVKTALVFAYAFLVAWVTGRVYQRLRSLIFRQVLTVGYEFLARDSHGRLLNIIGNEAWRTVEAIKVLLLFISSACMVAVLAVFLLLVAWELTVAALAGLALASLFVRAVAKHAKRLGYTVVECSAAVANRMVETLNGIRVVRIFGQETTEQERFDRILEQMRRAMLRAEMLRETLQQLLETLYVPLLLTVLAYALYTGTTVGGIIVFLLLFFRLQPPLKAFEQCRVKLASSAAAITETEKLLDPSNKPYTPSGKRTFSSFKTAITFENVTFRYDDGAEGRSGIEDVSFDIKKGQTTAIVGSSGAGKSTIINLLCRLYDPGVGEILVDGCPLREFDVASWRARLAIAGQGAELMTGTVRENIAYGCPDADDAAIAAAARRADIHEFISTLPRGYDSEIGTRGLALSGGQQQRIALARALLRNPAILILDEATNALDSVSEAAISRAIDRMAGQVTMIVIAHRLSTIRHADQVIVLDRGRVIEQGPPESLLRAKGLFSRLYELQVGAVAD
jgi:ATP-binding cassette, subfamily B, bacterial MsbA